MEKRESYLSERRYEKKAEVPVNDEKVSYWRRILGADVFRTAFENDQNLQGYLKEQQYDTIRCSEEAAELRGFIQKGQWKFGEYEQIPLSESICFASFYKPLLIYGIELLKKRTVDCKEYFSEQIFEEFAGDLATQLESLCVRTLIVKMHMYKDKNMLVGDSKEAQYEFFCNVMMQRDGFIEEVFEEFPVLLRCVAECIQNQASYYLEILTFFVKDRDEIRRISRQYEAVKIIENITGNLGDTHNHGRRVVKVHFDHGQALLYKPHSMENEKNFMRLLGWICKHTKTKQYEYACLSYDDHSWSEIVAYKPCLSKEEVADYYYRMGEQLFLAYLLGTKDLHCENIIASGAYPILIDLETLVNLKNEQKRTRAYEEIYYQLSNSVLGTGILPFYTWNKNGKGVNYSALNGGKGQQLPFKIPVLVYPGTSDMRIEYHQPMSKEAQNLVRFNEETMSPAAYKNVLTEGFTGAYRAVMQGKEEFQEQLQSLRKTTSRFLITDTQRYSMALTSSYHPILLRDGAEREIFLNTMWMGREAKDKYVVETEIEELLKGDIPYFYYRLDDVALYAGGKKTIEGYFYESAMDILHERLERLDLQDMRRQCGYIETALDLLPENRTAYMNRIYRVPDQFVKRRQSRYEEIICSLEECLLAHAVWNDDRTQVSWPILQIASNGNMAWNMVAMGMYLYNGLAGMLVLFCKLADIRQEERMHHIFSVLRKTLFDYTESGLASLTALQSRQTGAYEGEASIVYAYLIVYEMRGDEEYLAYAKRHAGIVRSLLSEDKKYDLIAGNAGAAYVFIKLYEITQEEEYISWVIEAVKILEEAALEQECGIGWDTCEEAQPLSGMAHGNSGILMPFFWLYVKTGQKKYENIVKQILAYEQFLYDERIQNWTDMRPKGSNPDKITDDIGAVAWCHGAPGILLSRIYCYGLTTDDTWRQYLKKDILCAYKKTKEFWMRDSLCLCHGVCGNLAILKKAEGVLQIEDKPYRELLEEYLCAREFKESMDLLLPQEKLNPGFMNGYGGILLLLLCNN